MSGFNTLVDVMEIFLFCCVAFGVGFVFYIFCPPFKKFFDKLVDIGGE